MEKSVFSFFKLQRAFFHFSETLFMTMKLLCWLLLIGAVASQSLQCSLDSQEPRERDPALQLMDYDVGEGKRSTWVYIEPSLETMYDGNPPSSTKVTPKFNGFAGKFINMSNQKVTLYWESSAGGKKHAMRNHNPFTASGTATFPGHRFVFSKENDPDQVLITFVIGVYPENLYVYDPYLVEGDPKATEKNLKQHLSKTERKQYEHWQKTLRFNDYYVNATGRTYLANYLRPPPTHFMWPGDYFGQMHYVETLETHFVQEPPPGLLQPIRAVGKSRILKESDPRPLAEYRAPGTFNMTLQVLSVAPRAFEIPNFLSSVEVDHITELASGIKLSLSSTGDVNAGEQRLNAGESTKTRTSYNSWVPREKSPILDAIYRRAADLMRMDESLLRSRDRDETTYLTHQNTIAEQLQLVNYKHKQEYTSHHDFGYSRIGEDVQPARFGTLLLYLNEGMKGGETSFPRWVNGETFRELKIVPKVGKAVLFYSQLPDGNLDDFSQHAALPVTDGEKWLINLWTWDPEYK